MCSARTLCFSFLCGVLMGCGNATRQTAADESARAAAAAPPELDFQQIEDILGIEGSRRDGQYKVALPQNELSVSVDGFRIIPPMGLTSWAVFAPVSEGAILRGDLVLREDEIGPLETTLIASGLTVSALHNHFVRDQPKAMFVHVHGVGPQENLARGIRTTFDKIRELRRAKNLRGQPSSVETTI